MAPATYTTSGNSQGAYALKFLERMPKGAAYIVGITGGVLGGMCLAFTRPGGPAVSPLISAMNAISFLTSEPCRFSAVHPQPGLGTGHQGLPRPPEGQPDLRCRLQGLTHSETIPSDNKCIVIVWCAKDSIGTQLGGIWEEPRDGTRQTTSSKVCQLERGWWAHFAG